MENDWLIILGGQYIEHYEGPSGISGNFDFNQKTTCGGVYAINSGSAWTSGKLINGPAGGNAFVLLVIPGSAYQNSRIQFVIEAKGSIFQRQLHITNPAGTTEWKQLTQGWQ